MGHDPPLLSLHVYFPISQIFSSISSMRQENTFNTIKNQLTDTKNKVTAQLPSRPNPSYLSFQITPGKGMSQI